jgi:hypothetical protein
MRWFLNTGDSKLTGNLWKHRKKCWGEDVIAVADKAKSTDDVQQVVLGGTLTLQLLTTMFERQGVKGKVMVTHSNRLHT